MNETHSNHTYKTKMTSLETHKQVCQPEERVLGQTELDLDPEISISICSNQRLKGFLGHGPLVLLDELRRSQRLNARKPEHALAAA